MDRHSLSQFTASNFSRHSPTDFLTLRARKTRPCSVYVGSSRGSFNAIIGYFTCIKGKQMRWWQDMILFRKKERIEASQHQCRALEMKYGHSGWKSLDELLQLNHRWSLKWIFIISRYSVHSSLFLHFSCIGAINYSICTHVYDDINNERKYSFIRQLWLNRYLFNKRRNWDNENWSFLCLIQTLNLNNNTIQNSTEFHICSKELNENENFRRNKLLLGSLMTLLFVSRMHSWQWHFFNLFKSERDGISIRISSRRFFHFSSKIKNVFFSSWTDELLITRACACGTFFCVVSFTAKCQKNPQIPSEGEFPDS